MNLSRRLRIQSLKRRNEIQEVFDRGKKIYLGFGLLVLHNRPEDTSKRKVAVLVKKQCGNAVVRNQIKRVLRHVFCALPEIYNSYNRVVILYRERGRANYHSIYREMKSKI
ncbi:MAG TPA: ribonuclease P protein component [Caldithrix abyssi]|uniref:Ribonuclease P protein component n=1 Tax=Caldithrix abyssi TaxID=187145 RepID=A0A7V4TXM0_CALAY|nr:ribonuclease P protein component [Caldithrix abyssi]